ncbi:MAG: P-type Ca2+ transporter type [Patescibacteria group bacterium]|nr:P-type Ca2+ transporter type [Patescibacteria group bacterium]
MPKKNKKQIYNLTLAEIFLKYDSSENGLAEDEAEKKLRECGRNQIQKKRSWKWVKLVGNQFNDALVWILLVAAGLASIFGEFRDVTIILIIVFINALIGFLQEFKAERILDSLKKLAADKAIVIRGGEKKEIDTRFIVPGDVIFVSSGDRIPADGYILESYSFKVNSFIFTGESKPEPKSAKIISESNVALADIDNMVFMGEDASVGEARFVVTATGMDTQLGRIANLTQEVKDEPTPLQRQMRVLGRNVSILAVFIGAIVFIAGQYFKMSLYQNFLFALALSVSVVPEGLPAAISVALSLGMRRLLKNNVLAKKLNAVETLGSVSVICTDKTGTITKNELTVTRVVVNNEIVDISGTGYAPYGDFTKEGNKINPREVDNLELLFKIGTLCNDAELVEKDGEYKILGDPTEGAIAVAGKKFEPKEGYYAMGEKKITENPFSSERMRMSVVYRNTKNVSYVKGSPDVMIDLCKFIKCGGAVRPFFPGEKETIRKMYNQMSAEALRVLAFAYREMKAEVSADQAEKDLIWVGMMAMIDPARQGAAEAIAECREAGIRVIMITGDYELTAEAIAKNVGLFENQKSKISAKGGSASGRKNQNDNVKFKIENRKDLVINGNFLERLNDREIYTRIKNGLCVFARIAPEQKLRIANILKKYGAVIAMTGDGVNDAPALKRADIGVAMGIIGTDVSKEASDMILLDDNFASIVNGVKQGRTVFSNLKKFVHYVFTSNAGELFTVIFGVLLQIPAPVSAVQILAIDLGTDVFPSFSLSMEPEEPGGNNRKEIGAGINSRQNVMSFQGFRRIAYLGILMAAGAVVTFIWSMMRGGWNFGEDMAADSLLYIKSTTAAYAVLSMTQMANLLQSRSERLSPFALGFFKNKYLIGSIFISVVILLSFMYLPVLQYYLGMAPIDALDWLMVFICAVAVFLWEETRKSEPQIRT